MVFKNKFLLLILFLIIILQTFLYTNNTQKTSFRFFKWYLQEVSIGKLISVSFFSGLFMSTLLNTTTTNYKKNTFENIDENREPLKKQEDLKSNIEMPPQRDIRDSQPTISVNYRVIKNTEENNYERDKNYSSYSDSSDDWDNNESDW
tara:strand:- start:506 stop:949 length:444 start_codon:yes stop_codon:yes gene_type:complete